MALLVAVLAALFIPFAASAQCSVRAGGQIHVDAVPVGTLVPAGNDVTFIDLNRPAIAHVEATAISFAYTFFSTSAKLQFASLRPLGRQYLVRNATPVLTVTADGTPAPPEVHRIQLSSPLVFEAGDVLAVLAKASPGVTVPPGVIVAKGEGWAGTLAFGSDAISGGPADLDSPHFAMGRTMIGAFAEGPADCSQVPAPEVILPVTGDVSGRVHYTTDVSVYISSSLATANVWPFQWTIRDRLQNPSAATRISGTSTATRSGPFVGDSMGSVTGLPLNYFGPMIVSLPASSALYSIEPSVRFSDDVIATARIAAQGGAGDVGSSVQGVSCDRIGHVIAIPFHRTANQRVNIGIASAQLASCGVFSPATSVLVAVNSGPEAGVVMPAESAQLNDITAPGSVLPSAIGLMDGVVRVGVIDEAARIVAYASIVDNTSHAATITVGRVER